MLPVTMRDSTWVPALHLCMCPECCTVHNSLGGGGGCGGFSADLNSSRSRQGSVGGERRAAVHQAFPSQPTHFWNDENGSKNRKAYFSKVPGRGRGRSCPPPVGLGLLGSSLDAPCPLKPGGAAHGSSCQWGDSELWVDTLSLQPEAVL